MLDGLWHSLVMGCGLAGALFAPKRGEARSAIADREREILLHAYKDLMLQVNKLVVDLTAVQQALKPEDVQPKMSALQLAAFHRTMAFTAQFNNLEAWPDGPLGQDDAAIRGFFEQHVPEGFRMNGRQRFFFHMLAKRGGEIHRGELRAFTIAFSQKFPAMVGAPALLAELELETLGFVTRESPDSPHIRIAEPFYSRLKSVSIP